MNTKLILLAYATRYGSTQEVAEKITTALREAGCEVDLKPMAIFSLGPLSTSDSAMLRSRRQLDKELANYPWLKPASLEVFAGKYDPTKPGLGLFYRLLPTRDYRDWEAIRAWAQALFVQMQYDGKLVRTR